MQFVELHAYFKALSVSKALVFQKPYCSNLTAKSTYMRSLVFGRKKNELILSSPCMCSRGVCRIELWVFGEKLCGHTFALNHYLPSAEPTPRKC